LVKIEFLGPIGKDSIQLDVSSLDEVGKILRQDSEIAEWLDKCAIAVNDEIVFDKNRQLFSGDKISLLPPVCGG
jgi:molybdopterin synthase sulfur carrier subunit